MVRVLAGEDIKKGERKPERYWTDPRLDSSSATSERWDSLRDHEREIW